MRKLSIFGATGTIGDNTLDLVDRHRDMFDVQVLSAHENVDKLARLARKYMPTLVVISNPEFLPALKTQIADLPIQAEAGPEALQASRWRLWKLILMARAKVKCLLKSWQLAFVILMNSPCQGLILKACFRPF